MKDELCKSRIFEKCPEDGWEFTKEKESRKSGEDDAVDDVEFDTKGNRIVEGILKELEWSEKKRNLVEI